jgi:hypothetical protein
VALHLTMNLRTFDRVEAGLLITYAADQFSKATTDRTAIVFTEGGRTVYQGWAHRERNEKAMACPRKWLVTIRVTPEAGCWPVDNVSRHHKTFRTEAEAEAARRRYEAMGWECEPGLAYGARSTNGGPWTSRVGLYVHHPYGGVTSPRIVLNDWREALVALTAHELQHIDQFRRGRPASEVECERASARVLAAYREDQERDIAAD